MILTELFVINVEEGCNFILTLRYTLENGLSSCLVTSYNDNFCSIIGFSNSCMPVFHRQRVAREDLPVSQKVRKHLLKLHLMPIKSLSSYSASVALDIKKLSDPFRTAPDILLNGLCNLCFSPLSKSSIYVYVFVDSLHVYTKLIRQICQDDGNWIHFKWIIYMICWLIKKSTLTEKSPQMKIIQGLHITATCMNEIVRIHTN